MIFPTRRTYSLLLAITLGGPWQVNNHKKNQAKTNGVFQFLINSNFTANCETPKPFRGNLLLTSHSDKSKFRSEKTAMLIDFVLPLHPTRSVFDQTLFDWVEKTTQDYQLLDYAPQNLTIQIAFLRLIGIKQISLTELSRKKGSKICFLNHLNINLANAEPYLVISGEEVLSSIGEFTPSKHSIKPKSLDRTIGDPLLHVKPTFVEDSKVIINKRILEMFYRKISQSTDSELQSFCESFLVSETTQHKQLLFEKMQTARTICTNYLETFDNPRNVSSR